MRPAMDARTSAMKRLTPIPEKGRFMTGLRQQTATALKLTKNHRDVLCSLPLLVGLILSDLQVMVVRNLGYIIKNDLSMKLKKERSWCEISFIFSNMSVY